MLILILLHKNDGCNILIIMGIFTHNKNGLWSTKFEKNID